MFARFDSSLGEGITNSWDGLGRLESTAQAFDGVSRTLGYRGIPGAGNTGRFQYTGQAWVSELGMYYYKARVYSPTLGRFLQTDPIGYADQVNRYAYVGNDPMNGSDPSGLACAGVVDIGCGAPKHSIDNGALPKSLPIPGKEQTLPQLSAGNGSNGAQRKEAPVGGSDVIGAVAIAHDQLTKASERIRVWGF